MMFTKRNIQVELDASKYKDYESYFKGALEEPLWLFELNGKEIV